MTPRTAPSLIALAVFFAACVAPTRTAAPRPNIVLVMTDDQGWGDLGLRGHPRLLTPHLDDIAAGGVLFERFYASSPVCSPTRASVLTGRHPFRMGIRGANVGHLPQQEHTLAELLGAAGYATGHFGKWHLGTLTTEEPDSNRGGPAGAEHYSPPWEHGFGTCFSTEAKVPTLDPMITPPREHGGVGAGQRAGTPYGTAYWTGPGQKASGELTGDDSTLILDRALSFVDRSVAMGRPFLAVIWLHAPHLPVVASPERTERFRDLPLKERHFLGCLEAVDANVGRLRERLRALGVERDTLVWFTSDNGPRGRTRQRPGVHGSFPGSQAQPPRRRCAGPRDPRMAGTPGGPSARPPVRHRGHPPHGGGMARPPAAAEGAGWRGPRAVPARRAARSAKVDSVSFTAMRRPGPKAAGSCCEPTTARSRSSIWSGIRANPRTSRGNTLRWFGASRTSSPPGSAESWPNPPEGDVPKNRPGDEGSSPTPAYGLVRRDARESAFPVLLLLSSSGSSSSARSVPKDGAQCRSPRRFAPPRLPHPVTGRGAPRPLFTPVEPIPRSPRPRKSMPGLPGVGWGPWLPGRRRSLASSTRPRTATKTPRIGSCRWSTTSYTSSPMDDCGT